MKKNLLFGLLTILVAGFGFGGISMATDYEATTGDANSCTGEPSAGCYTTLSAAISAAAEGDTVTLLGDVDIGSTISINKNLTIDLNGFNISATNARALHIKTGMVTITGSGTISANKDGESNFGDTSSVIRVGDGSKDSIVESSAKLIIGESVTISSNHCYGITVFGVNNDGDLTTSDIEVIINGIVNVSGTQAGISGNGNSRNSATTIIIGSNAEVIAKNEYAIYHPGKGELTVNGKVKGTGGIEAKAGTVTINDGAEVIATATEQSQTTSNDGTSSAGYAIASISNENYTGDPKVTINGGTIEGVIDTLKDSGTDNAVINVYSGSFTETVSTKFQKDNATIEVKDAEAKIGTVQYKTINDAVVSGAKEGDIVEILKNGPHGIPTSIPNKITIKGDRNVVFDASSTSSSSSISSIPNGVTFDGVTIKFPNNDVVEFGFFDAGDIVFNNCMIEGRFYTYGNTTYKDCELVGKGYPITVYRGNVTIDGCTIESKDNAKGGYYINAYNKGTAASSDHSKVEAPYSITVSNTKFKNSSPHNAEKEKSAINIHEYYPNTKTILSYNVTLSNITLEGGNFPTKWYGGSEKYMLGDIMSQADTINGDPEKDDINYGTENGGNTTITLDGVKVYSTPKRDENGLVTHTVTFDSNGGTAVTEQTINDGSKATEPSISRNCYTLNGWYNGNNKFDFNNVITDNITLKANWTYSCSTSGGGSRGGSASATTTKKDETKVTTGNNEEITLGGEVTEESTNNEEANKEESKPEVVISDAAKSKYKEEQLAAYQWAYENGITTINNADEARLGDPLTRAELAKMMSQYISSVLKRSPIKTDLPGYKDVDESLGDLADYIVKAYQYQIMGIDADGNALEYFNPNGLVTRAEYATVFSRVLYGSANNQKDGPYYEKHLAALKEAGILTEDDPTIQEVRGWVMLMMYRSVNPKAPTQEETKAEEGTGNAVGIANPASTYCVQQEGEIEIREDAEGAQYGVCKFKDGTEVEEWEYFRANHKDETSTGAVAESSTGAVAENATGTVATTGAAENN